MCTIYISHFEQTDKHKYDTEHTAGLKLLCTALSDRFKLNLAPEELKAQLKTNAYGKPYLISHEDIHFNISHCEDMAACALSTSPVGVDIEKIQSFSELIIKKVLTPEEQAFLKQMHTDEKTYQEWFFRFWTLKESRIKQAGMGFSMPLLDFSFSFDTDTAPYKITCTDPGLYFTQQIIENQYIIALCSTESKPPVMNCLLTI